MLSCRVNIHQSPKPRTSSRLANNNTSLINRGENGRFFSETTTQPLRFKVLQPVQLKSLRSSLGAFIFQSADGKRLPLPTYNNQLRAIEAMSLSAADLDLSLARGTQRRKKSERSKSLQCLDSSPHLTTQKI